MKNLFVSNDLSLKAIKWRRLVLAGVAGTLIFITLVLLAGRPLFSYGAVVLPKASETMQFIAGGAMSFTAVFLLAFFWAFLFMPVKEWPYVLKIVICAMAFVTFSHLTMPGEPALTVGATYLRFGAFGITLLVISIVYGGLPWKEKDGD